MKPIYYDRATNSRRSQATKVAEIVTTTLSPIVSTFTTTMVSASQDIGESVQANENKGLEWFLRRPWAEKPDMETFSPEEIRWVQIQLVLSILIVTSTFLALIGCCCLRIPTLISRGGKQLTHALRIWKAKLPRPADWTLCTAMVAIVTGIGHCLLCCLYKKDDVPEKTELQEANDFEMVELGTIANENYREPLYATIRKKKRTDQRKFESYLSGRKQNKSFQGKHYSHYNVSTLSKPGS